MTTFYTESFSDIDATLAGYVTSKAAAVMSSMAGVATTMFVIYVAFYVLAIAMGKVREPVFDFSLRLVLVALILGIGLNMGLYMKFFGDFLSKSPDALSGVISGAGAKASIGSTLDKIMTDAFAAGDKAFEKMSLFNGVGGSLALFTVGIVLYAVGVLATFYAGFLIVLSKIMLAVLLAVGPIVILLMMFKSTQRFFESWLSLALNYGLTIVLTVAVISLMFEPIANYVHDVNAAADVKIGDALILLAMGLVSVLVLMQVPSMASGLGGGLSLSTLGFVERASSGLYRRTWQRQPYSATDRNGNPTTVYRRPITHRTGQVVGGAYGMAKNLYRRASGHDTNRVERG